MLARIYPSLVALVAVVTLVALWATPVLAQDEHPVKAPEAAEATVDAFHHAITSGDGDSALAHLAPEVVIFEEGGGEMSREEYASHHLGSDMSFSAAVKRTVVDRQSGSIDGVAWVLTRSTSQGTFREFEINSQGAETMLLRHTEDGWRIIHIHWSSHAK